MAWGNPGRRRWSWLLKARSNDVSRKEDDARNKKAKVRAARFARVEVRKARHTHGTENEAGKGCPAARVRSGMRARCIERGARPVYRGCGNEADSPGGMSPGALPSSTATLRAVEPYADEANGKRAQANQPYKGGNDLDEEYRGYGRSLRWLSNKR